MTVTAYIKLKDQIRKLQKQAELVRNRERAEVIRKIRDAIVAYEITAPELGLTHKDLSPQTSETTAINTRRSNQRHDKSANKLHNRGEILDKRRIVLPKYRDPDTGATWTGRGKQPKWVSAALASGRALKDLKI